MDSVMLGSLHTYQRWIKEATHQQTLSLFSHGCAGAMAGFTVSFVASPIEHIKVKTIQNLLTEGAITNSIFLKGSSIFRSPRRLQKDCTCPRHPSN